MKKQFIRLVLLLLLSHTLSANCQQSSTSWQNEISKHQSIEQFFLKNYSCKKSFYQALSTVQKQYFDTIVYPGKLSQSAYTNRWSAMSFDSDRAFFQKFTFFNNYYKTHKSRISQKALHCFQKQKGMPKLSKSAFFSKLKNGYKSNDVSYLYPLIRWAYVENGVDMRLSRERVNKAEKTFGIKKGKVGNKEQFARYIALFEQEYDQVTQSLASGLDIEPLEAYKLLLIITYLESRGNLFAVSTTGAFGPTQLTMHYYMMYGEPSNPFDVTASLSKLANKFIHYHHANKSIDSSVIAYKSGSLEKCRNATSSRDVDCRYYNDYKKHMRGMRSMHKKADISKYFTGKSYFSNGFNALERKKNTRKLKAYEPYQYAVIKGNTLSNKAQESAYLNGKTFRSLGRMKRSEIYELQDKYGSKKIGVISDKKVCY